LFGISLFASCTQTVGGGGVGAGEGEEAVARATQST